MRTLSPKALLTAFNPSPVFEAVAIFAERLVLNGDESKTGEIDGADDFAVAKRRVQMSSCFNENAALRLSDL